MMSNNTNPSIDNPTLDASSPEWTHLPFRHHLFEPRQSPAALIDHYLVVVVNDYENEETMLVEHDSVALFAVHLRDKSVRGTKIPLNMFLYQFDYSFTTYKDNQIIKYGGRGEDGIDGKLTRITIESYERIFY